MNAKSITSLFRVPSAFMAGLVAVVCILLTYIGIDTPAQTWAAIQPITLAKIGMLAGAIWTTSYIWRG